MVAPNNTGMIVVRVGELLGLPHLKPYVEILTTPDHASLGIRIRLSHSARGPATRSVREVGELVQLTKATPGDEPRLSDSDRDWLRMYGFALEDLDLATESLNDGTADVVLTSTLPFDQPVRLFAAAIADEVAAE